MEDGASLFSPDYVRPSQWRDLHRSANGDAAPIKRLMFAILEVSLRDLTGVGKVSVRRRTRRAPGVLAREATLRSSRAQVRAADARAWIFDDDDGPFAFQNVCDVLGIDSARLRARLGGNGDAAERIMARRNPVKMGKKSVVGQFEIRRRSAMRSRFACAIILTWRRGNENVPATRWRWRR